MDKQNNFRSIDLYIIAIANLFNLIMVVLFYLRTRFVTHPLVFGYIWAGLIIVLVTATIINIRSKRNWWTIAIPLIFAVFLIVELILDYIL